MPMSRMTRPLTSALGAIAFVVVAASAQSGGSMGGAMPKKDGMAMDNMHQGDAMAGPGVFHGISGSVVLGHMTMAMKGGHSMVQFAPDFKIAQNKNIDVVLSADMMYSANTALVVGKLGKASGTQELMIPAGAMMDHYNYALLRDRSTGMVVGAAKLPAMSMMDKDGMAKDGGMMKHDSGMMKKPGGGR